MNILYISSGNPTFVRKDIDLLSEKYNVSSLLYSWNSANTIYNFIKQFLYLLLRRKSIDIILIMFAGYWSVIPVLFGKLFKKRVFIILGGTDCVSYPKIEYGSLRKPLLKKAISITIKKATCILPVHESLIEYTNTYFDNSKQGIKNHIKGIVTPFRTVYNGYEPKVSKSSVEKSYRTPNSFICVALINNRTRMVLKGIDLIFETAHEFPQAIFTIIGINKGMINKLEIPKNVKVIPPLANDALTQRYLQSEFVIQTSISEGFPNALCEAMSHGCIPVVSPVGAMPTIVENIGIIVPRRDRNEFSKAISRALSLNNEQKNDLRLLAYTRIVNSYSEKTRLFNLVTVFEEF